MEAGSVSVSFRGHLPPGRTTNGVDEEYVRAKLSGVYRLAPAPVRHAEVVITAGADPASSEPIAIAARVNVDGHMLRGHVVARDVKEGIDHLVGRLERQMSKLAHRGKSTHLRHRNPSDKHGHEAWHHGDPVSVRSSFFHRANEEREYLMEPTHVIGALIPEEAADDLEILAFEFCLFTNADTGEDNVLYRDGNGDLWLTQPTHKHLPDREPMPMRPSPRRPGTMDLASAVEILDLSDDRFVFFIDQETNRGKVVYRRHDGHYGVVEPDRAK